MMINFEKLKAENERMKSENEKLNKMTGIFSARLCKKYHQTLQEIKAIVKNVCDGCTAECDCDEDCNYFLIIEALAKAESEDNQ